MTSFAKKYNSKKPAFLFEIPKHFVFKNLKQLVEENGIDYIYKVNSIYINTKGKFGDAPVIATNREMVNAPSYMVDQVKEILKDAESVYLINNGYVGFKIYTYLNQYGTQYAIEWIDFPEPVSAVQVDEDIPF